MGHDYSTCLAIWQEALKVEIGIAITPESGDLRSLLNDMYKAREKSRDPTLQALMMYPAPDGKELWICRKPTRLSER